MYEMTDDELAIVRKHFKVTLRKMTNERATTTSDLTAVSLGIVIRALEKAARVFNDGDTDD